MQKKMRFPTGMFISIATPFLFFASNGTAATKRVDSLLHWLPFAPELGAHPEWPTILSPHRILMENWVYLPTWMVDFDGKCRYIYIYHNYDPMGKDGRKPSISAKAMCFLLFFAKKDLERLRTPKQRWANTTPTSRPPELKENPALRVREKKDIYIYIQ